MINYENKHDDKQLSITTPRQEMLNSIENIRHMQDGDKTIKGNTIEEDNFRHDTFLDSSGDSLYISKESGSNSKHKMYDSSSWGHNSNSKYSNDYSGAKHSKLHSDRSHNHYDYDEPHKEKGLIYVEGRNKSQIKVPMIPIDKGQILDKSKDSSTDNYETKPKSNRSSSSKKGAKATEPEKNPKNWVKYFPISISSRNVNREIPYSNKESSNIVKNLEEKKNDYNNIKIGVRDLEVIKENHSEFSNSNSVIETFRNKRKSNISSSGNNSGDQKNIHDPQEMINEEDEDFENDTTSFRGPKKLKNIITDADSIEPSQEHLFSNRLKTHHEENKDSSSLNKNYDFDVFNNRAKVFNFDKKFYNLNRHSDQDFNPSDMMPLFPIHQFELDNINSRLMRSSSMSPTNNRLSRSYSSDIPQYIINQRPLYFRHQNYEPIMLNTKNSNKFWVRLSFH